MLLLLQHRLHPARPDHRTDHRALLAPGGHPTGHPPTAPDPHGPARPRQRSIKGPLAHGYREIDGQLVDLNIDPSFAGAAGRYALATTVRDLSRFLDTLLAGRLFGHRATLKQMLSIAPAQGEGGLVGIGHLGGAVYRSYVGRLRPTSVTIALAMTPKTTRRRCSSRRSRRS